MKNLRTCSAGFRVHGDEVGRRYPPPPYYAGFLTDINPLKVHKIENYFGSEFEFFYYFIFSYAQILRFCKKVFLIGP